MTSVKHLWMLLARVWYWGTIRCRGPKKLKHQVKVPARAGRGAVSGRNTCLQTWCVGVCASEQGPRGGENIPAPGATFNLVRAR